MEIKKIGLQEIELANNPLEGTKFEGIKTFPDKKLTAESIALINTSDTHSVESFESIKKLVGDAVQPGRAEMIAKIKDAVANGEFNVDSMSLANAMMADGFQEFLG